MSRDEERKIQSVFERLRQEEERFVPEFHKVLSGRESTPISAGWGPLWRPMVALLLLVIIAGPILYVSLRESGNRKLEISSELEVWESPTDFLLSFNDSSLDFSLPEIGTTLWKEEELGTLDN